ncbi:tyrosine-type recombinase/integrase [Marinivivus vitaminiproducens]|uniref:tyrosine-type recombinase/integrase n=1 Tax=Marinivivus vitaminiproducens TaxID=3035935 RepID=UPI0027A93C5A|nr:hypothetical protein P4R82_08085 [Geminicoccaceae bacterium SCSIO 64248]
MINVRLHNERPQDIDLATVFARYKAQRATTVRSNEQIARSLRLAEDHFGAIVLAELTPGMLEDWGRTLVRAGAATGYVRRIMTDVRSALNWVRKRGEVAAIPYVPVTAFDEGRARERIITAEETARLLMVAEPEWLRRFIMIAAATGARTEAILELSPFQIDRERGLIDFRVPGRRETKKRRPVVRIAPQLAPWLTASKDRLVGRGKKALGIQWREAREAARLGEDVVPTTFRHTLHTLFDEQFVPESEVLDWFARPRADKSTDHYTKRRIYRDEYLSSAVDTVAKWLAEVENETARLRASAPGDPIISTSLRASCVPTRLSTLG